MRFVPVQSTGKMVLVAMSAGSISTSIVGMSLEDARRMVVQTRQT